MREGVPLSPDRSGFYFSVDQEGSVAADDAFQLLKRNQDRLTVSEMNRFFVRGRYNQDLLRRPFIRRPCREYFSERLERPIVTK